MVPLKATARISGLVSSNRSIVFGRSRRIEEFGAGVALAKLAHVPKGDLMGYDKGQSLLVIGSGGGVEQSEDDRPE